MKYENTISLGKIEPQALKHVVKSKYRIEIDNLNYQKSPTYKPFEHIEDINNLLLSSLFFDSLVSFICCIITAFCLFEHLHKQ